ncbi:hypothetical protein A5675_23515 [Mycobacterium malmoense]|nr:hypothetical protein A5675_23515 [Mycobacterium malmoense]
MWRRAGPGEHHADDSHELDCSHESGEPDKSYEPRAAHDLRQSDQRCGPDDDPTGSHHRAERHENGGSGLAGNDDAARSSRPS